MTAAPAWCGDGGAEDGGGSKKTPPGGHVHVYVAGQDRDCGELAGCMFSFPVVVFAAVLLVVVVVVVVAVTAIP